MSDRGCCEACGDVSVVCDRCEVCGREVDLGTVVRVPPEPARADVGRTRRRGGGGKDVTCHRIRNGVVCVAPQHEFTHEGRTWRFEIGMMGYPWPLKRDGTPWKDLPGERHPFWRAFVAWQAQQPPEPNAPPPLGGVRSTP